MSRPTAPTPRIRPCARCNVEFDATGTTRPLTYCSDECRRLKHVESMREYRRQRSEEIARLRGVVHQLESALEAA